MSFERHNIFMVEIRLEEEEVKFLRDFVKKGRKSAREITRARILLLANQQREDTEISKTLDVGRNTVWRIKRKYWHTKWQHGLKEGMIIRRRSTGSL